ncbi:unnamed protein product [Mycena citricolor]|uniref:Major facilitator superfamily domain-containing protein n=1 Tax=Mycena citricolor TaxID=2018698 RepID=A0AAD2H4X1_9AGAR|nr:unnamed protein product [Mycena citricolor]
MTGDASVPQSATESTPLLSSSADASNKVDTPRRSWLPSFSPYRRVLFATMLLSLTFGFTSTPLMFAYRVFACDEYYESHPPYDGEGDRCAVAEIEKTAARDIGVMVALTALSGMANLLLTTWQIRHWGLRSAIVQQTFWPALRNLTQIYSTFVGGRTGITILQTTQLITIFGGGQGYALSANSYIAELVAPEERTAAFGVVQGIMMFGNALAYIGGGLAYDVNISAPFELTFFLLVGSTLYSAIFLPNIKPATLASDDSRSTKSWLSFLDSLAVFGPWKYEGKNGRFWGVTLLGVGSFASVLATAYVPLMLQLTATNRYGFRPINNGYLMSLHSLSRALFLTFIFPRIIASGRKWFSPTPSTPSDLEERPGETSTNKTLAVLPTDATSFEPSADGSSETPDLAVPEATDIKHGSVFDLTFLRWSIILDAFMTSLVAFNSQSWHVIAAAGLLPLASGTAPACKGVLLDMLPPHKKADALSGISVIETVAYITTAWIFSGVFAVLSDMGHPNVVFFCNAGLALLGGLLLLAIKFPRWKLAL